MAFCANCGAQAAGSFCPNCGSSITGGAGASSTAAPGSAYSSAPPVASAPGLTTNMASALCYLAGFITGIIFLVLAPYNTNKTIRFHAFQSIFLNVAWIVLTIVFTMLALMSHGIGFVLFPIFHLALFLLWLYMMYTAYNGQKIKLPVVGDLAEKQA